MVPGVRKLSLGLCVSLLLFPTVAGAVGLVAGAETTDVRIAVAQGPQRTTRWYSITASGTAPMLWVIPTRQSGN